MNSNKFKTFSMKFVEHFNAEWEQNDTPPIEIKRIYQKAKDRANKISKSFVSFLLIKNVLLTAEKIFYPFGVNWKKEFEQNRRNAYVQMMNRQNVSENITCSSTGLHERIEQQSMKGIYFHTISKVFVYIFFINPYYYKPDLHIIFVQKIFTINYN